jgi:hypothetical protein
MCTTVPPAKSNTGYLPPRNALRKPPVPHTMCATGKYTKNIHSVENTTMARKRTRSANAPAISAGVMMANMS